MEASIDKGNPVQIAPRMAVPLNGNEVGVAIAEFTVEPEYRYEIQYELAGIYRTSRLTIVRHNGTGGENTVLYATPRHLHPFKVLTLVYIGIAVCAMVSILLWLLFSALF